jgi:hypothetical protein
MWQPQVVKRALYWYQTDLRKQRLVKKSGRQFGLQNFVETGTYKGDMTAAARRVFKKVYSIELHQLFYERAKERFKDDEGVKLFQGDSGEKIPVVLAELEGPALFWLDAHGGAEARLKDGSEGPAPLMAEIVAILKDERIDQHLIFIDDAHVFSRGDKWGAGIWPELEKLRLAWLAKHPEWIWLVEEDVIKIYKPRK